VDARSACALCPERSVVDVAGDGGFETKPAAVRLPIRASRLRTRARLPGRARYGERAERQIWRRCLLVALQLRGRVSRVGGACTPPVECCPACALAVMVVGLEHQNGQRSWCGDEVRQMPIGVRSDPSQFVPRHHRDARVRRLRCLLAMRGGSRVAVLACLTLGVVGPSLLSAKSDARLVTGSVVSVSTAPVVDIDPCADLRALVNGEVVLDGPTSDERTCRTAAAAAAGYQPPVVGAPCVGASVQMDDTVEVRNGHSRSIASATLASGRLTANGSCSFGFTVTVPFAARYTFVVDERPRVSYTDRQLRRARFVVGMTV